MAITQFSASYPEDRLNLFYKTLYQGLSLFVFMCSKTAYRDRVRKVNEFEMKSNIVSRSFGIFFGSNQTSPI